MTGFDQEESKFRELEQQIMVRIDQMRARKHEIKLYWAIGFGSRLTAAFAALTTRLILPQLLLSLLPAAHRWESVDSFSENYITIYQITKSIYRGVH